MRTTAGEQAKPHVSLRLSGRIFSFPALLTVVLVAKVYWTCRDRIADPDMWWHLRNAQYLVTNWRFPNVDTYSFTAAGSPWLDTQWLSELFYYAAFRTLGLQGIFLLFTSVLAVMVVGVFYLCLDETDDPLASAIATIFGGLLAMVGFAPRTQLFAWLCFVAIYAILRRFRSGRRAPLWLIPVLFCVWINCHGSWLMGLTVYGIFVCAGLIRQGIGRLPAAPWSNRELKKLILTGLASVAALAVNPYGYRFLLYPFEMALHQRLITTTLQEWTPVDFNDGRGILVIVVLGAVFATALVGDERWRLDDALFTALVLYCGLTHIRFLLLAGVVLPPILAPKLGRLSSHRPASERRLLNAALLTIVAAVLVLGFPSKQMLDGEIAGFFPARAIQFLRAHPQPGRMFNLYAWGGYLEWTHPEAPPFIDGRGDIFEYNGCLRDYEDIVAVRNTQEIFERYQITYVLYQPDTPLSYFLSKGPQWERIYIDDQAIIFRSRSRP